MDKAEKPPYSLVKVPRVVFYVVLLMTDQIDERPQCYKEHTELRQIVKAESVLPMQHLHSV